MIGTELSDIIFGVPTPAKSQLNLGVIKTDMVNTLVHGHNPGSRNRLYYNGSSKNG
jgi:carbon-monoxide dehydrogenase catalytic subunit